MRGRRAAKVSGLVAAALLLALAALYALYRAAPPGYIDPDTIPPSQREAEAAAFRAQLERLAGHVLSNEPFEVTFADSEVNAYVATTLARTGREWYEHLHLPEEVDRFQLRFEDREVVLFGRLRRGLASCIFSARITLAVTPEGRLRVEEVVGVRGGRLPVPRALLGGVLRRLEERPLEIHVGGGHDRARLREVRLGAGTIRLIGGPEPARRETPATAASRHRGPGP